MKDIFPCKNCQDRVLGCHGTCQKYKDAKTENIKRSHEIISYKKIERDFVGYVINEYDKISKRNYRKNKVNSNRHY